MRGWKDIQEEQSTMHLLLISSEFHVYVILCTLASTIDCNNHAFVEPWPSTEFHGLQVVF